MGPSQLQCLIPLSKNPDGTAVRLIAMPTVWRKAAGLLILHKWRGRSQRLWALTSTAPCVLMAVFCSHRTSAPSSTRFIRRDVQSAFGAVHRTAVLQAVASVDPLFAKCLAPWLRRSSGAVLLSSPTTRDYLQTNRGVPQGDPLSSVVFSLTLSHVPCSHRVPSFPRFVGCVCR